MRMASTLRQEDVTLRTSTKTQATIHLQEVKTEGRRIHLRAELELDLPLPAQDERLPATLERAVEDAGQRLERLLFQWRSSTTRPSQRGASTRAWPGPKKGSRRWHACRPPDATANWTTSAAVASFPAGRNLSSCRPLEPPWRAQTCDR